MVRWLGCMRSGPHFTRPLCARRAWVPRLVWVGSVRFSRPLYPERFSTAVGHPHIFMCCSRFLTFSLHLRWWASEAADPLGATLLWRRLRDATQLLGQIHLPQERRVTRVGCKILEQRLANDFDETRVPLLVRT